MLIGGAIGGVIGGVLGAIIAIVATVGVVFIFHLIIIPSRLDKEARHKYILDNANYVSRIFGNKKKRRYLEILDCLKPMIEIENRITDSKAGKIKATPEQLKELKRKFNEQTNVPLLPDSKALKLFLSGKAGKTINQTIKKPNLNIVGDTPTDNQIEFFIKTKNIMDESPFGIANSLTDEYLEYSRKLEDLIEEDEELPDWIVYLLTFPSGFNSSYLWYCCQGKKRQNFFLQRGGVSQDTRLVILEYKSKREYAVNILVDYAEESIKNM